MLFIIACLRPTLSKPYRVIQARISQYVLYQDRPQVVRLPEPAGRGSKGVCSGDERLFIRSLDAPLACFGRPSPFPVLSQPPDLSEGVSFNLHNNAWGTNYPIWVPLGEEDVYMAFRFELEAMRLETPL